MCVIDFGHDERACAYTGKQGTGVQGDSRESRGEMYVEPSFCLRERDVRSLIRAAHRVDTLLAATLAPSVQVRIYKVSYSTPRPPSSVLMKINY